MDTETLLCAEVAGTAFAVDARHVERVAEIGPLTPLPRAPAHLPGLLLCGSRAVPLLDLALFLGLGQEAGADEGERLVVLQLGELEAAVRCRRVRLLREIEPASLTEPQATQGDRLLHFARAELHDGERIVTVLDVGRLLEEARV
jgi:purine-binding chemotaxis protein CheW